MADARVTQAGRQVVTQEEADARVTQAGRQVVTQEAADARVTQAGRQVAGQESDQDLRVTMMGRQVLLLEPAPTRPELINPVDLGVYSQNLAIVWGPSTDPLGGAVEYQCRYKADADTVWTDIFVDRDEALDRSINWDITGDTDGLYNFELWATTVGYSSQKNAIDFTIHNGIPTEPNITAPTEGQKWQQTTNDVDWDAATDPDDDPLTYDGQYKLVTDTSWTSLFTGLSVFTYAWNQTALAVGLYELEVWANDGTGDGPADHVFFEIFIADEPTAPRIRIIEIGTTYAVAELEGYVHPFSRAWKSTQWQLIPFGGDWSNPIVDYTTTDSLEQLLYTYADLPTGFMGMARARFQDELDVWGEYSTEALFVIPAQTTDWERRWERNHGWEATGLGQRGTAGDWGYLGPGYHEQPVSAIVDPDFETIGSYKVSGFMMAGGCYCGWIGTDTELQAGGIGVFIGDSQNGGEQGVVFGIDYGVTHAFGEYAITGGMLARPYLWVDYGGAANCSEFPHGKTTYGDQFIGYTQVTEGVQPRYGQPIGPWVSEFTHWPIYKVELWVQRDVTALTSRIRGRINYLGFGNNGLSEVIFNKTTREDEWDIDITFNCLTVCGKPGFWRRQWAYAWESAYVDYFGLQYTALRDLGQQKAFTRDPLVPWVAPAPGACVVQTEDALVDPVLFPCPPNGDVDEDWISPSNVITARDDSEQRISLRDKPASRISFQTTLLTSREVQNFKALLWEQQPDRWGVPMWMDTTTLAATLSSGAGSIPNTSIDIAGRRFEKSDWLVIWEDQFTWDFMEIDTVNPDGSITLVGTTTQTFDPYKTQVIPVRIGRMMQSAEIDRDSPEIGDVNVTFVLEAVDDG